MNLCFDALDLSVVRGLADEPAVRGAAELSRAQLLEEVGALAGLLRGVGVEAGSVVMVALDDPFTELLTLLAAARLGATLVQWREGRLAEHRPMVVVADRALDYSDHVPGTVVLKGAEPVDPLRDVPWEMAMRAGRSDPAGTATVSEGALAWVVDAPVSVAAAADDQHRYGRWLRDLAAGRAISL